MLKTPDTFSFKPSQYDGEGLFVNKAYKKGDFIAYIKGPTHVFRTFTPEISENMLNWIGVSKYTWIDTTKSPFRKINHSCEPNVAQVSKRKVIAIKDIHAGEEITMDYSLTEAEPDWSIDCKCKSKQCRHKIGPITTIPRKTYRKYKQYIPKKFQEIYEASI